MTTLPPCPQCHSELTYQDNAMLICPECAHEWRIDDQQSESNDTKLFKDANGAILTDGDTVTLIKDLKIKGTSAVIKVGTKVRNIKLVEGDHDIDCKIDGFGAMKFEI